MSTYTDASLIYYPSGVKAGKAYSLKPTDGSGDLTFTRASTATRVNSAGLIESVATGVPRIDYTSGCGKLLLEPQRTNLVFPSATASTQTVITTAQSYTLSFYGTGTVVRSGTSTGTLVGTGANDRVFVTFTATAGSLTLTITGSVTDWQLEAGAYSTSVIITTTTAVTRVADSAAKTGISSLINSPEGSFYVEAKALFNGGTFRSFSLTNGTEPNRITFNWSSNASVFLLFVKLGGTLIVNNSTSAFAQTDNNKVLLKWGGGTYKLFINGVLKTTLTGLAMPSASLFDRLTFDASFTPFEGRVQGVMIFPNQVSDTDAIALTTL